MVAKTIMFQGTGSDVGKSLIVSGVGRYLHNKGYKVAPFKPQNMSNNSSVTKDGGEIGRAQNLQALACGSPPSIHMNPILLKPEAKNKTQVIVHGKIHSTIDSKDYLGLKKQLLDPVLESFHKLVQENNFVIVEGAGSPAEVNLRENDIANMGFAAAAKIPVILIGDINRGGVIAQIVGTKEVLNAKDCELIRGFIINKFQGNPKLFDEGYKIIEQITHWEGLGVLPWHQDARLLPAEDTLALNQHQETSRKDFKIYFLVLDKIANFDDLDPLKLYPDVQVEPLFSGDPIPVDANLVIIPGSKSTRNDATVIQQNGWNHDLIAFHRRGGKILGLCGGYQILGKFIHDPHGYEGPPGTIEGLGLLDVETEMLPNKILENVQAIHAVSNIPFESYEIHLGNTYGPDCFRPFSYTLKEGKKVPDGAISHDGRVQGTYLHGLFVNDAFRANFLKSLHQNMKEVNYLQSIHDTLDKMANHLDQHLAMKRLISMMC